MLSILYATSDDIKTLTTPGNHYSIQLSANNRRRRDVYSLSREDQDVLDSLGYKKKLDEVDKAILVNADFLSKIVQNPEIFGHELDEDVTGLPEAQSEVPQPLHESHSHDHPPSGGMYEPLIFTKCILIGKCRASVWALSFPFDGACTRSRPWWA